MCRLQTTKIFSQPIKLQTLFQSRHLCFSPCGNQKCAMCKITIRILSGEPILNHFNSFQVRHDTWGKKTSSQNKQLSREEHQGEVGVAVYLRIGE